MTAQNGGLASKPALFLRKKRRARLCRRAFVARIGVQKKERFLTPWTPFGMTDKAKAKTREKEDCGVRA
jgi:hypothetical protein